MAERELIICRSQVGKRDNESQNNTRAFVGRLRNFEPRSNDKSTHPLLTTTPCDRRTLSLDRFNVYHPRLNDGSLVGSRLEPTTRRKPPVVSPRP
ncbi:hypothetical protein NPIL_42051 [Nephila pilipes]|uniref:Uncharacterized protein n=1 Tax=Nephila pilipes TaxID=299642 RepID=A0A8X6U1K3_NEPPI|nr:hypothetical protein NPIL_42051 [Nephila pilipes]